LSVRPVQLPAWPHVRLLLRRLPKPPPRRAPRLLPLVAACCLQPARLRGRPLLEQLLLLLRCLAPRAVVAEPRRDARERVHRPVDAGSDVGDRRLERVWLRAL
jgi:hypothetical protein